MDDLQSMLDAGEDTIPAGTFHVTETLTLPRDRVVRGAGRGRTILRGLQKSGPVVRAADGSNGGLSDVTIDGTDAAAGTDGLAVGSALGATFERIDLVNPRRDGLILRPPPGGSVLFCAFRDIRGVCRSGRHGMVARCEGGAYIVSNTVDNVHFRGDAKQPMTGTGFLLADDMVRGTTLTNTYVQFANTGYADAGGRNTMLRAVAEDCDLGFTWTGTNPLAVGATASNCATDYETQGGVVGVFLGDMLSRLDTPLTDTLRLAVRGPQLALTHPDYKRVEIASRHDYGKTLTITNATDGIEYATWSQPGDVRFPRAVATGVVDSRHRPDAGEVGGGATIFDIDLGRPIWSTGTAWVDATGAPA